MTLANLYRSNLAIAIIASAAGTAIAWLAAEPAGLLAPVAAFFLHARGRLRTVTYSILLATVTAAVLVASSGGDGVPAGHFSWIVLFAVAGCIGAIILADAPPSPRARTMDAARSVENVVGNAWATDAAGRFIYVTPAALTLFGLSLDDLNSSSDAGVLGWKQAIHPGDYDEAAARWRRCLLSGEHLSVEHRMLRATGDYAWGRATGTPLRDDRGAILGWYGTVIDVEVPLSASGVSLATDDPAPADDGASDGLPTLGQMHPHDRSAAAQAAAYAFWTGVPQVMSYRRRQPDGSYRLARLRAEPGYPVSVDVDAMVSRPDGRWTTTAALGDTIEAVRAAKVIESLYGKAWAFDVAGQFTYATPAAQTAIAMTLNDLNAPVRGGAFVDGGDTGWSRGVHPDDYQHAAAGLRHSLKTGDPWNVEYRMLRATGQYVWHRVAARPTRDSQGRVTGWYGTSIDIDVYKRTEAVLRDRERELSQLINMVPSHLWRLTPAGEPVFFSKRMIEFLGLDVTDLDRPGQSRLHALVEAVVHPDDAAQLTHALARCLETGMRFSMRYRLRRSDGVYRWMSSGAEPMRDQAGMIVQWYGLCHDVDDQMRAEDTLRASERSLHQLVETLPALIYCAMPDGTPTYRSQRLREFLGFDFADKDEPGRTRLGATFDAIIHPDDLPVVQQRYHHSLSTGEPYAIRHRLRRFDGEYRWVETRAAAMRNAEGAIVQWNGVCLEIEEHVRAQERLTIAQQRLARAGQAASLAELSASIAHEMNQPLAAIVANSHACHRWLAATPPNLERARVTAERIIRDANSAADVVSRIRALFKQSVEGRKSGSLAAVIAEVRDIMAGEASQRRVRMDVAIENDLPAVVADRIQIQQVLLNLIRNGMDAMNSVADNRVLRIRVRLANDAIQTEISDSGPGVETPDRIFEPFFTTKEQGMGMGLAICRSIVEAHGGKLWVERAMPHGATFIFTLPVEASAAP